MPGDPRPVAAPQVAVALLVLVVLIVLVMLVVELLLEPRSWPRWGHRSVPSARPTRGVPFGRLSWRALGYLLSWPW